MRRFGSAIAKAVAQPVVHAATANALVDEDGVHPAARGHVVQSCAALDRIEHTRRDASADATAAIDTGRTGITAHRFDAGDSRVQIENRIPARGFRGGVARQVGAAVAFAHREELRCAARHEPANVFARDPPFAFNVKLEGGIAAGGRINIPSIDIKNPNGMLVLPGTSFIIPVTFMSTVLSQLNTCPIASLSPKYFLATCL